MRQTVGILGTPIDILDTHAVLSRLEQFIHERRFHQVATANTDFLINAVADPELRSILRNADLVMPDGMPVVWAARLMGTELPERVTGADIVPMLAELASRRGYSIYMLGARPEVAKQARERLEEEYPGLRIVGCESPPVRPTLFDMDNEEILERIRLAAPDILLVAFGNPKQEKWIHLHREALREVPVCIGVGGTFDFLAGHTRRAPGWMQTTGLEWLYRLAHEPRRLWRRYVRDIWHFSRYLVRQWWALRPASQGQGEIDTARVGDCTIVSVIGHFGMALLPQFQASSEAALNARTHLVLDFGRASGFDAAALGTLINVPKRAAHVKREVRMVAMPPRLSRALRGSQLADGHVRESRSVAEAFSAGYGVGLNWQVLPGVGRTVVTVSGVSDAATSEALLETCSRLLATGHSIDMDAREVVYVDSYLLSTLYRLTTQADSSTERANVPRFRVVAGQTLMNVLVREKMVARLPLTEAVASATPLVTETLPLSPLPGAGGEARPDTGPLASRG